MSDLLCEGRIIDIDTSANSLSEGLLVGGLSDLVRLILVSKESSLKHDAGVIAVLEESEFGMTNATIFNVEVVAVSLVVQKQQTTGMHRRC